MNIIPASEAQLALAKLLGVSIAGDSFDVAAAKLLDVVAESIGFKVTEPCTERQSSFAASLDCEVSRDSKRVASARIGEALHARNREAIATLKLKPGDRVVRVHHFEFQGEMQTIEQEFVISSIQPNGRVFFKGGNGQGAWPTELRRLGEAG